MADIKTEKQLVAVLNDPNPSNINLNVGTGVVGVQIKNEGVIHTCLFTPDEAVKVGVSLIQLAHQAAAMAQAQIIEQQQKGNGHSGIPIPPPGIVGNMGRVPGMKKG